MTVKKYLKDKDTGLLFSRLGLGLLFLYGGIGKLTGSLGGPGLEMFSGMVWGSMAIALIVALVELLGGIGLLVGIKVREAGVALAIVMAFAIFLAHNPFTMEGQTMNALIRLALLTSLLGLAYSGSGKKALSKD